MDHDGDGILDIVSGSYDPGDLYLFRGLGKGRYAAGKKILDERGLPLVHHPDQLRAYQDARKQGKEGSIQDRVASFGSWPAPVDWDGDGDLDMLIGSFDGRLWLRTNTGTRTEPVYAKESVAVHAGGVPLQVECHADPFVADWNGDGRWDLVVGSGDGSVGWYENTGTATAPVFAARQVLVAAKAESKFDKQLLAHGQMPRPGVRAQICVVDHDLDGKLDLLLGDWCGLETLRELTAEERLRCDAVERELAAATKDLAAAERGSAAAKQLQERVTGLTAERKTFLVDDAGESVFGHRVGSFVWLFRRR